jgi:hypothetical protein
VPHHICRALWTCSPIGSRDYASNSRRTGEQNADGEAAPTGGGVSISAIDLIQIKENCSARGHQVRIAAAGAALVSVLERELKK